MGLKPTFTIFDYLFSYKRSDPVDWNLMFYDCAFRQKIKTYNVGTQIPSIKIDLLRSEMILLDYDCKEIDRFEIRLAVI